MDYWIYFTFRNNVGRLEILLLLGRDGRIKVSSECVASKQGCSCAEDR